MTWLLFAAGAVCGAMLGLAVACAMCVSGRELEKERLRAAVRRARLEGYESGRASMRRELGGLSDRGSP